MLQNISEVLSVDTSLTFFFAKNSFLGRKLEWRTQSMVNFTPVSSVNTKNWRVFYKICECGFFIIRIFDVITEVICVLRNKLKLKNLNLLLFDFLANVKRRSKFALFLHMTKSMCIAVQLRKFFFPQ